MLEKKLNVKKGEDKGVLSVSLFGSINDKESKRRAVEKLESYRQAKRVAGESFTSKVTAVYSFEPRSYTGRVHKPIEDYVVRRQHALIELERIEQAINMIPDAYARQVLFEKYCRYSDKSDIEIYVDLGYSETEYYRLVERGVRYFYECYNHGELIVLGDI